MRRRKLGDVCSRLSSGKSIKSSEIKELGSYPVIGGNGVRGYTENFNFEGECAVVGRQGAACGNVRFYSGKAYMTEHAVVAVADEGNDSRYLAYLLSTMHLGHLSAQSAQPGLSVKTLSKQEIDLPPLEDQRQIVGILGTIDDKIAANTKLNGYLAGLVSLEFMSRFSENVPTVELGQVLSISTKSLKPQDCFGEVWEHYSIPAYDEKHWPVFEPADGIKSNKYIVDKDCFLISKLNPTTKRIWMPACSSNRPVCSTEFIVYKPNEPKHKSFYYAAIDAPAFTDFLLAHVTGSTGSRQRTQPKATLAYPMPAPGTEAIEDFCAFADPIYEQIKTNELESKQLEELRDVLLPRLMSGKIDVSKIDLTQLNSHLSGC